MDGPRQNRQTEVPFTLPPSSLCLLQIELLPPGAGPAGEDVVASLYGSDVVLSNAKNGQVIRVISCGEGEVRRRRLAVSLVCACVCVCVVLLVRVRKRRSRGSLDLQWRLRSIALPDENL